MKHATEPGSAEKDRSANKGKAGTGKEVGKEGKDGGCASGILPFEDRIKKLEAEDRMKGMIAYVQKAAD